MIIFQPPRLSNILRVDRSNFFSILDEDDHFYTAEIRYEILQSLAVTKKLNRVKITAYSSFLLPERFINNPAKPSETINSLLTYVNRNSRLQGDQEELILGTTSGDIFGSIDKRVFSQLSSGKLLREIPEATKTVIKTELKSESEKTPSKKEMPSAIKEDSNIEDQNYSLTGRNLALKDGIDPAKALKYFSFSQSKIGLKNGIAEKKTMSFNSKIVLLEKILSKSAKPNLEYVTYSISEIQDYVEIKSHIKIKKSLRKIQFRFELFSVNSDIPVDVQEYSSDFFNGSKILKFLFHPPEVTATRTREGIIFGLKQTNRHGTSIEIYSKKTPERSEENNSFEFLDNLPLSYGETGKFFIADNEKQNRVFRFICKNETEISPKFESYVLKSVLKNENRRKLPIVVDYTESVTHPMSFSIRGLKETSRTIQFFVKNLTKKMKEFEPVGEMFFLQLGNTSTTVLIPNMGEFRSGDSFQVICKIHHSSGLYTTEGGDIFTFHDPKDRDTSLQISLIDQKFDNTDITFNIFDGKKETQTEIVRKIISSRGNYSLFQKEIEENKGELDNIVAHQIERINLTTGVRENLGILPSGGFSDKEQSQKHGIPPANKNESYRYLVKTLSSNSEILFGDYRKEIKDKCETKVYTYFPSKFQNFWTLKRGTIPKNNKNIFLSSYSGITKFWDYIPSVNDISFPNDIKANLYNSNYIEILFSTGLPNIFYDHFVLSKVINGDKIIIDTIHSQFTSEQRFLYQIENTDQGEIIFTLTFIKNDYSVGPEIISNSLTL